MNADFGSVNSVYCKQSRSAVDSGTYEFTGFYEVMIRSLESSYLLLWTNSSLSKWFFASFLKNSDKPDTVVTRTLICFTASVGGNACSDPLYNICDPNAQCTNGATYPQVICVCSFGYTDTFPTVPGTQ